MASDCPVLMNALFAFHIFKQLTFCCTEVIDIQESYLHLCVPAADSTMEKIDNSTAIHKVPWRGESH